MKLSRAIVATLSLLLVSPGLAQQQPAQPTSPSNENHQQNTSKQKDDVVKISVTLVQVDVTVTDGKGRSITGLKPEDFEVFQNKKPQHITNFSYVAPRPAEPTPSVVAKPATKGGPVEPPAPPPRLKPEQVRRAIALVVDDLTLSFESMSSVRQAGAEEIR